MLSNLMPITIIKQGFDDTNIGERA